MVGGQFMHENQCGVNFTTADCGPIPLVVQPDRTGIALVKWIDSNRELVAEKLLLNGALLCRGFAISEQEFPGVMKALCGQGLQYTYRSTPRTDLGHDVYTATEYPAHQTIPQHNENSYARDWPMKLAFFCACPAEEGGETPIADCTKVSERIDPQVARTFVQKSVLYVRNYGSGVDLPWENVFQTEKAEKVELYCRAHDIKYEWLSNGCLRTSQICQAIAEHPRNGRSIWFNQAHLFHTSSLDTETVEAMMSIYQEDDLPRNAYYGDGSKLDWESLDNIRKAYEAESVVFTWKQNDVLLLDNMLISHGRKPFKGKRRVLVSMGEPYSSLLKSNSLPRPFLEGS